MFQPGIPSFLPCRAGFWNPSVLKSRRNISVLQSLQEVRKNIKGLGSECKSFCKILNLPNIITLEVTKADVKRAVKC